MWHELSSNILSAARPCVAIILHSRYNFWGLALMAQWREKEHESQLCIFSTSGKSVKKEFHKKKKKVADKVEPQNCWEIQASTIIN